MSANTRDGKWGLGAIETISQQLQKELPGPRGFSATNLKNMRLFYEAWAPAVSGVHVSSVASDETYAHEAIQIRQMLLTNLDKPIMDAFFSIGFTHHSIILSGVKELDARLFYVCRCALEHLRISRRCSKGEGMQPLPLSFF